MKKYTISLCLVVALTCLATLATYGQNVRVFDTIEYKGRVYELGITSLKELGIDPKLHNYVKLVDHAQKAGFGLCPSDSISLKRIGAKVPLEPDNRKFEAFVATVPFRNPETDDNALWTPRICGNDGYPSFSLAKEPVGYFAVEGFEEVFPAINTVAILGYFSIGKPDIMYDWVFMRPKKTGL